MPIIMTVEQLDKIRSEDPTDELLGRDWWQYTCSSCGNNVLSDIHFSFPLHCIKCHGDMPETTPSSNLLNGGLYA